MEIQFLQTSYTLATMTRSVAIAAAPATRRDYWVRFVFNACLAVGIPWAGMVYHSVSVRIFLGLLSFGYWMTTAQCAERLFFPVNAARRSMRLSAATKERLMVMDRVIGWLLWIATAGLFLLSVFQQSPWPLLRSWVLLANFGRSLQYCIGDLSGVKAPSESDTLKSSPTLANPRPLQSSHWGEEGTARTIV